MTKQIKSALSLLLVAVMLLGIMPQTFAADITIATPTVTTFGDGVSYFNDSCSAELLTDNYYFTAKEVAEPGASGGTYANLYTDTEKAELVTFSQADSGIEYSWDSEVTIKRLELWILGVGGVKEYEVQSSADGSDWSTVVTSGSFADYKNYQNIEGAYRASYYPIIFDSAVTTQHLRFVIKSFQDDTNVAKIAETRVSDTNEINLGDNAYFSDELGKNPYLWGYNSSGASSTGNSYTSSNGRGFMWAYSGSTNKTVTEGTGSNGKTDESADGIWYVTTFDRSLVKVNRVGLTVSGGSISQFEVWATSAMDYEFVHYGKDPDIPDTTVNGWTKVGTFGCNINASSTATFDLPDAIAARGYLIKIPAGKYTDGTAITSINMYALADDEVSDIAKAASNLFGSITTDTDDSAIAEKQISGISESFEYNGSTYSVVWESSSELVDAATGAIGFHEEEEKATLTAKVSDDGGETYTVVSKTFTLLPVENVRTVAVSAGVTFESGSDASVLTDGFLFSAYDRAVNGNITADGSPEKFAKITAENSYIEYNWLANDKVRRLDVWAYPAGAIGEYEIQTSDDGAVWSTYKSGDMSENVNATDISGYENQAVYLPILFDMVETKHLRFVIKGFNDGFSEAYIAEAMPGATNDINFAQTPKDADGLYNGYSHYMSGYVTANTSDIDPTYRKSSAAIWPTYSDGTSPDVIPSGTEVWYATSFATTPVNINRVVIPVLSGSTTEIELLCAAGDESGFELTSDYPAAPDTLAEWKTVAVVRGAFNAENAATIDITDAPSSKYWMVRAKNASSDMTLGRAGFYLVDDSEFTPLTTVTSRIFDSVETDHGMAANTAKTSINLLSSYEYDGVNYPITWESSSPLLDISTGNIAEHDNDEKITLTAIIVHPENSTISYCVSKEFLLEGMLTIYVFDENGKTEDGGILTDEFTYSAYDREKVVPSPNNAYYNPDKFVWFDKVNSGFEFYMEKPKVLKRLELWQWPVDAIRDYEIQVSSDGNTWTTHYSGTFNDQYADNPASRPTDMSDEAGTSAFYPIVFDRPTEAVNYIRFVIKSFRDETQGAYVAEASFGDTNDVDYLALGTNKGAEGGNMNRSIYTKRFYSSEVENYTVSYRRNAISIWPIFSNGTRLSLLPREGDLLWYVTGFQEAPVAVNKVIINVSAGEVYEYEVLCPATSVTGISGGDYPVRPDTVAEWKTIARVSGKFTGTSEIHFDNDFASKFWMIKITQASDDVRMNRVGLYTLGEYEMNKSSFILDDVFDGVSDTAIDNVIKEKMNLPEKITVDGVDYEVLWSYDDTMVNPDGTLIPSITDREMTLKARVGATDEDYKHVLEKTYYLLGSDDRARTALYSGENISLTGADEEICSAELEHGFTYSGSKELEIDFASLDVSGKIQLMAGEAKLLELSVRGGQIIANEGSENESIVTLTDKIRLGIDNGTFSLAGADGTVYTTLLYNEEMLSDDVFDTVKLVTADGDALTIESIAVNAVSEDLFDSVTEQFVFSKISPVYKATNLNGNLTLIDKVADITFSYASGDSSVISIDGAVGTVNLTEPGETSITVTGTSASTQGSFTKTFNVLTGVDNVFEAAKSTSPAAAAEGKTADFAVDGNLESEFVTSAGNYRINVDLQENKAFSRLRIFEADTTEKIEEFSVLVSSNNVDFTEVYKGTAINSGESFAIDYSEARFVRIMVTKTSGSGTGIREICAYNEMTDLEKLEYDYEILTDGLTVKDGTTIPKTGKFGTVFTLTSDSDAVTITETADKSSWKVTVGSSDEEVTVNITLSATNGTEKADDKSYQITVLADTDIRGNKVSGGGSSGGSSGGRVSSNVAFTPNAEQLQNTYRENELTNHWGANEIKTLIARGIVQGDGSSLNLKGSVTRAEFCKMIVAGLGYELIPHRGSFADINGNEWFASYAETALEHGIMSGDERGFRGNDTISRQEMAMVLVNALKAQLGEVTTENDVSFTDYNSIAEWAKEAVGLAAGLGILNGYDTGDFKPDRNLQRDEAMVVVYRVLSHVGK